MLRSPLFICACLLVVATCEKKQSKTGEKTEKMRSADLNAKGKRRLFISAECTAGEFAIVPRGAKLQGPGVSAQAEFFRLARGGPSVAVPDEKLTGKHDLVLIKSPKPPIESLDTVALSKAIKKIVARGTGRCEGLHVIRQ